MINLAGKRVAIISTDYFEEAELVEPLTQLKTMNATVTVAAPHAGTLQAVRGIEKTQQVAVDMTIEMLDPEGLDLVILPGGVVNADHLRINEEALTFIKAYARLKRPIAAICHGPWLLVSGGLVRGKTLTSYPTLKDDILNAGGIWVDEEVVEDDNLITSRNPRDIPGFMVAIENRLKGEAHGSTIIKE